MLGREGEGRERNGGERECVIWCVGPRVGWRADKAAREMQMHLQWRRRCASRRIHRQPGSGGCGQGPHVANEQKGRGRLMPGDGSKEGGLTDGRWKNGKDTKGKGDEEASG
jgi:hypothetical protein